MRSSRLLAVAIILGRIFVSAQSIDPSLETGVKPYGSYHGGDLDVVSLSNGNLSVHIPLAAYPQRGDLSYAFSLNYNNKGWYVVPNCNSVTGVCSPYWAWHGQGILVDENCCFPGLSFPISFISEEQLTIAWAPPYAKAPPGIFAFTATSSDGSIHQLAHKSGGMITIDGTNIWYDGTTSSDLVPGTSRDHRGNSTNGLTRIVEDANGNFFAPGSTSTFTDTLGRNFSQSYTASDTSGCTGPLPIAGASIATLPGLNGVNKQIKLCSVNVQLQSNFQASSYYNNSLTAITDRAYTAGMLQSVVIYNGISWTGSPAWTFEYNSRSSGDVASVNYGDLTRITLPTGGTITYTWGMFDSCDPQAVTPVSRAVTSRTVNANDGAGPRTWTYGGGLVTDPNGNDTVHTFTYLNFSCSPFETKTQYFQGSSQSGQLLKTVATDYRWIANPFDNVVPGNTLKTVTHVFPIRITTTWPSGKVTKIEKDYDSNLVITAPSQFTGTYGNVTEIREYDYGDATHAPALVRRTDYNYKAFDGSSTAPNYLAFNLVNLVSSVTVYDGGGTKVSQTTYGYDESSLTPFGVAPHDNAPPNVGTRGNLTSVTRWLNTTGGTLTTKTTYYDTGTPYQVTDPAGNVTTNSYATGFQSGASFAGAYVTQVQNALQQNTYFDYDFNTGLRTAVKDVNGNVATSDYDFLNRILHSNAPDKGLTTWGYNDTQPPIVTVTNTITGTQNTVQVSPRTEEADLDGLGRLVTTKLTSDPEGTDFVDTTYDAVGRVATVSNPHRSTASSTDGITISSYDALGRVTQVTSQDGGISTTDYSQFPTVTVTDQAGNQRRSRTDGLGRLVEVDEPAATGPPTYVQGSISISSVSSGGGVQSAQVLISAASQAKGSVTINGRDRSTIPSDCPVGQRCIEYDNGSCGINQFSVPYGNDAASTIAANLANQINSLSSTMTALASGSTVSLTSIQASSASNFAISSGCSSTNTDFTGPSGFSTTQSGPTLTGGRDAVYTTVYDSGTVTLTIPGCSTNPSAAYSQTGNNSISSVAAALAGSVNSITGCPVSASPSGSAINLTARQPGSSVDVTVSGSSSTSQGTYFSQPSFSASSGTVSGGLDHSGGFLTPATTLYSYDVLDNLTQVQQQGFSSTCDANCRVRSFQYDSLSRLTSAINPESGKITYSYDADGNLQQKTSPAPNAPVGSTATQTISYCYDALNRVTGKAYSPQTCTNGLLPTGIAVVSYTYDLGANGVGRLSSVTDAAGSGTYTYDVMGRIASETRTIAGITQSMSYLYYVDGSINQLIYPSGATLTYTPSSAARMLSAVDSGNGINYAAGATYDPTGALSGFVSGNGSGFAGITNSFSFDKRLQPVLMSATSPTQTVFSIAYDFHLGNGDNGNVYALTNSKDNTRNQTFTYDQLNRLTSAQNAGSDCSQKTANNATKYWGNIYSYDAWGNLLGKTATKCSAERLNASAGVTNQLHNVSGPDYSYDAAGNMTQDATTGNSYSYDAENRITGTAGYTYTYDADGNRVEKSNGSTGTIYWSMSPGIVAESDLSGNLTAEYVFFGGRRTARKDFPSAAVSYYYSDNLGTASVITDSAGNIKEDEDFYPWGGELPFVSNDSNHYKYGGHERDTETGLDYMLARYYSNQLGRFLTPDWAEKPITVPYANFGNPQSLNLYTYGKNNPRTFGDPDGHCPPCSAVLEGAELGFEAGAPFGPWGAAAGTVVGAVGTGIGLGYINSKIDAKLASQTVEGPHSRPMLNAATPGQIPKPVPPPPPGTQVDPKRPGTHGKPDHKQTVQEEAKRVNGKAEQTIPTEGGTKDSRRADAVGTNPETGAPEIVQVYRPTPAGNIPKREVDAANDIENATGVKPTMVPVRPLPQKEGSN